MDEPSFPPPALQPPPPGPVDNGPTLPAPPPMPGAAPAPGNLHAPGNLPAPGYPPPAMSGPPAFGPQDAIGPIRCRICGATPAVYVEFAQNIGMVMVRQRRGWEGDACRECGQSVGRKLTNLTLVTGWTGMISMVTNFGVVFKNATNLAKLRRLPAATRPPNAPSPGRPVFLRPGAWVVAAALGLIGFVIASAKPDPTWKLGACISVSSTTATLVDCSDAHDGAVVAVVAEEANCPARARGYVIHEAKRYCIR